MSNKQALQSLAMTVASAGFAWAGSGNVLIGVSVLLGISALMWPHLPK